MLAVKTIKSEFNFKQNNQSTERAYEQNDYEIELKITDNSTILIKQNSVQKFYSRKYKQIIKIMKILSNQYKYKKI